ncbi:hypothetical protein EX30DRAFT_364126 [Ascodesmis nigricans]|uniref:pH-response transcription factor pacC/RIM101 n=1 Tax=Ascodesmis nigricans TaxID=341454 RepID=A0A4S2MWR7_9PEZI|nr:hypothetical protein EX30DRAFT_364126 [Ascodesmis nigricans]
MDSLPQVLGSFVATNVPQQPAPSPNPQQQQTQEKQEPVSPPMSTMATTQTQQPAAPVVTAPAAPAVPLNAGVKKDELACQWNGCSDKFDSAEDLYNHLCDIHVGRKSTNNLCLTCAWGACRTTTVKRDHITSHIRVHVPLKPHGCDFCGKAFKRPQDLKKHVKTHADDSVLLRSPEPDGTGRRQAGMNWQGMHHVQYTTGAGMQPLVATAQTAYYGMNSYYPNGAHNHQVFYYPHSPQNGQDALAQATATAAAAVTENSKKRPHEDINRFIDDVKRHKLQPVYDGAMAQRLSALQFVPSTTGDMQYTSQTTVTAPPTTGAEQYTLPTISTLKTKQEMIDTDQFLSQLSGSMYSNGYHQQQQQQQNGRSPHPGSNPPTPLGSATTQPGNPQALTPPTSNYTTSASPNHHHTPPSVSPQAASTNIYPNLPTVVTSAEISHNYAAVSSAPATSLAANFDDNRRYNVGMLRRARADDDTTSTGAVDVSSPNYDKSTSISSAMIDPSLGDLTSAGQSDDQILEIQRNQETIARLRAAIKTMINEHDLKVQNGEIQDTVDTVMQDVDVHHVENQNLEQGEGQQQGQAQTQERSDAESLYPILKAVEAC